MKVAIISLALVACHGKPAAHDDAARELPRDARPDAGAWPELARFPHVDPVRVIALPGKSGVPRLEVGGPAISGDTAVVASSQFGFVAVAYRTGQIAWSKPAGDHVAPPLAHGGGFVLIGDCRIPPDVPDQLLGCARVVTQTGADESYVAIHGGEAVAAFAGEMGVQRVWSSGDHQITWRRGERAVAVDLITGVATPAAPEQPLVVHHKNHTWEITLGDDGLIVAKEKGKVAWHTDHPYAELLGAVYLPGQSPMVRVSRRGAFGGQPELNLMDIDATGSMHGQVAFPVPGIAVLGHAIDAVGDTALAVRLDPSLERDFVVGYAANALLMWVYPLPQMPRADPVGVAVAPDAVLVFHDGDTLTVLPELSAPEAAPGAARPPEDQ